MAGRLGTALLPPAGPRSPRQLTMQPIHAVHAQTAGPAQEQPHAELRLQSLVAELEKREWGQSPGLGEPPGPRRGWPEKGPMCVFPLWEHEGGSQRRGTGSPGAQGQRAELGYQDSLGVTWPEWAGVSAAQPASSAAGL